MRSVFQMQQATAGVNAACIAALPPEDNWRCIFANYSYAHTRTPMFPLQSAFDSWQLKNIWAGDRSCASEQFANCSHAQIGHMNAYASDLLADLVWTPKFHKRGEGGFVESCLEHVAAEWGGFDKYMIGGTVLRDALSQWWAAPTSTPAAWWLPCKLNAEPPHQCMKSCL